METKKIIAMAISLVMITCVFSGFVSDSEADTVQVQGQYAIYCNTGEGWGSPVIGNGYSAYDGVKNALSSVTADERYTIEKTNQWGSYTTINSDYGKITGIGTSINNDEKYWQAFVYVSGEWKSAECGLGFYKCYGDYDVNFQTANVALYYGEATAASALQIPSNPAGSVVPLSSILNNEQFRVTFYVSVDGDLPIDISVDSCFTYADWVGGTILYGYGSDVATALNNAISCTNKSIDLEVMKSYGFNESYGYTTNIHGIAGQNVDDDDDGVIDHYYYWSSYIGNGLSSYAPFMFGFYTPFNESTAIGGAFIQNAFTLYYTGY